MKVRWVVAVVLVLAFVAGAWALLRPPELAPLPTVSVAVPDAPSVKRSSPAGDGKLASSAVLSIDPRAVSPRKAQAVKATLYGDYLKAKQLRSLYERIKNSPEAQTPEGQYILYEMLRRCATVTDGNARRPFSRPMPNREDFIANISPTDPQRDKRIAAFEEMDTKRCAGFEGVNVTQAELNGLLANAVNGGDPKARAIAMEQELWAERRTGGRGTVTLSDLQVDQLHQILASKDPGAMVVAGRILSNSWQDFGLRIGNDTSLAEPRALYNAWQILACDYGYPCGSDNARLLTECALQGHCQAGTLQDYLYYYGGSPHDSQLVMQYQNVLRTAIETGDWSQVSVVRGPRPAGSPRFFFGGAPR
jgi:hypothetical protein